MVDAKGVLKGLITVKDIFKRREHPDANKDQHGRLRVAAALGGGAGHARRARARWSTAGVDVLVVDSAHGHSDGVLETVDAVREAFPDVQLVAGNVATERGARELVERGVGRGEGRHRAGQHLHHARRHRRGRSADHRDHATRSAARATCRSSPTAASSTPATS